MRWRLEELAREEERKGRKVRIGYGKIKIEENWWRWDEEEEVLRDNKGMVRMVGKGEGEGGKREKRARKEQEGDERKKGNGRSKGGGLEDRFLERGRIKK